jgi:hypothetical protein
MIMTTPLTRQDLFKAKTAIDYLEKYARDLFAGADQVDAEDLQSWIQAHRDITAFTEKLNERLTTLGKINENENFGIRDVANREVAEKIWAMLVGTGKIPAMKGGAEKESIKKEIESVLDQAKPSMNENKYKTVLKALIREAKK